jgi:hypothetical protein
MRIVKWVVLGIFVGTTGVSCFAQKFPLRQGEWTVTTQGAGLEPMLFCLTDELWQKALTQSSVCTIHEFKMSSSGATYGLDCPAKAFQMKGTVALTFDGMEHMTAKALIDMTVDGKTTSAPSTQDYRWKSSTCSAADMNLRPKPAR